MHFFIKYIISILFIFIGSIKGVSIAADPITRNVDVLLAQQDPISLWLDCQQPQFDVPPVIVAGTTFVEVNALFGALGISISWNQAEQKVTGTKSGTAIELWIGNRTARVNGQSTSLAAAPFIATPYNRTMVPLSFISQSVGADVSWNNNTRTITISSGPCYTASDWTSGYMSGSNVPSSQLQDLNIDLSGPPIWKSNNPEVIRGNGWLMQNARTDNQRGGAPYPLSGCSATYLFHIYKSGSTKYLHLLATNPQPSSVNVSGSGSIYSNAERPLVGEGGGLNYWVARDLLSNNPRVSFNQNIASAKGYQIYRIALGNNTMLDGRFEICSSQGIYLYSVVTSSGSFNDALNFAQGESADGDLAYAGPNTFGREAGVYASSEITGVTNVVIPSGSAHLGFSFNTTNKFDSNVQNQTTPSLMRLDGASPQSYGNYGHRYDVTLLLNNPNSVSRKVVLYFASNHVGAGPSFTWNSPVLLNGSILDIYTTPSAPRQKLAEWTIPANSNFNANIELYVPGLITTNQQLVLQAL